MRSVALCFVLFIGYAFAICGDRVVDPGEGCDVGRQPGDSSDPACVNCLITLGYGCSYVDAQAGSSCYIVHGDGVVTSTTTEQYAGQVEQCDDGNTRGKDGCTALGLLEAGYYCDKDLSVLPATNPKATCADRQIPHAWCGDGITAKPETCDLGGGVDKWDATAPYGMYRGCSPSCQLVKGWLCRGSLSQGGVDPVASDPCNTEARGPQGGTGEGSYRGWDVTSTPCCAKLCGDGLVAGVEQCDDGVFPDSYSSPYWWRQRYECPGCRSPDEDTYHSGAPNERGSGWGVSVANRKTAGGDRGHGWEGHGIPAPGPVWVCADDTMPSGYGPYQPVTSQYNNMATILGANVKLHKCVCASTTAAPVAECALSFGSGSAQDVIQVCTDLRNRAFCGSCGGTCSASYSNNGNRCDTDGDGYNDHTDSCTYSFDYCDGSCHYYLSSSDTECGTNCAATQP